jgi:hypothetical protein
MENEEIIIKTPEEIILEEIRNSSDYLESKQYLGAENYNLIDKIEESSIILGKKAITQYIYNEIFGGCGSKLTIENI